MRTLFTKGWLLFLIICVSNTILLGGTTGKLVGRVTDNNTGEPLIGANVIIDGTSMGAATDTDGYFVIIQIPPGTYNVDVTMIGYTSIQIEGIRIHIDLTTTQDFQLTPSVIGLESVTVTAAQKLVQNDKTYTQVNVGSDEIDALPVEEFEDIVTLQSGVVTDADGSIHIRGGRDTEVSYMVDGVSVTDPFSYGMAIELENNAIQELQVISGTFNAEYGQAMSGIVNIVTKEGDFRNYRGSFSLRGGDYLSDNKELFPHVDDWSLGSINDFQFSLSGPLPALKDRGSLFISGRYAYDDGFLYGTRKYYPDSFAWSDSTAQFEQVSSGDEKVMPMNWSRQFSLQSKLKFKISQRLRLSTSFMASNTGYQTYTHKYRYNPDGDYQRFRRNYSFIAKLEHSLNPATYFNLMYSSVFNEYEQYVHDDPTDSSRYNVDPDVFNIASGYNFYVGGIRMNHYDRNTVVNTYKAEFVSQLNKLHQIKLGSECRVSNLHYRNFTIKYDQNTGYLPEIPDHQSTNYDAYDRDPFEFSGFIQDKIEYQDMILNLGVRYDYFNANWKVLTDPADPNYLSPVKPVNIYHDNDRDGLISESEAVSSNEKTDIERLEYWYEDIEAKQQFSPRLALAFPITDQGVMHMSYGHFFQMPPFLYLYTNPDFEVTPGLSTTMGNADLEPQRTTQYEVGFQQQLARSVGLEVTGFYKDIRNLLSTRIVDTFIGGNRYALYINRDYGNVRGVTLALTVIPAGILSGSIDYTYSIAEGNASDPASAYYDEQNGNEPEKQLVALDWDQRHTLNGTLSLGFINGLRISLIGQYGSGQPYTPSLAGTRLSFENSENKPDHYRLDLRSSYNFTLGKIKGSIQLNVYNLTDRHNELIVYNDTGRAGYSLISTYTPEQQEFNTLTEYLRRPDYYSDPRQIKFGIVVKI